MSDLRIFTYLPNPRLWKASIVARLCGVELDVRGAPPETMTEWLWDADARPIAADEKPSLERFARRGRVGITSTIFKTDAFLEAHPFGNIPAAFSPDGVTGIFESNSIMRAVARIGAARCQLYGDDPYSASRIDGFLDVTLLFARDVQVYVLALRGGGIDKAVHASTTQSFAAYLAGIDRALAASGGYLAGDRLSLADIAFFAELALLHNEHLHTALLFDLDLEPFLGEHSVAAYPRAYAHFAKLRRHEAFAPDAEDYLNHFSSTAKTR